MDQLSENQLAEIKNALFQGRKIEAIKLYRKFTDKGLAEAKTAVEGIEADLRKSSPEKFATAPGADQKGCRKTAVLICLCAVAVLVWLIKR